MISTSAIRDVLDAARCEAGEVEPSAAGSQALAERLYRIDMGQDLPDGPAGIEEIAFGMVQDHGTWAPEIPEQRAQLARDRGETEAAARWEACLAKVLALLTKVVAGDE